MKNNRYSIDPEKVKKFIIDHRLAVSFYILSTFLMLFQHSMGWNWDFAVYSMNGEAFFHGGIYLEWLRPPLASFIMGFFQFFVSRRISEYLFILTVSILFFYSSKEVAETYNMDLNHLYPLTLTPAAILFATSHGTEMLGLSFAMLLFSDIKNYRGGLWLSLAFLSRYTYGILMPLVLLQRDWRKMLKTLAALTIPVSIWLFFNWIKTGNPLTSILNYLALNVLFRTISETLPLENLVLIALPSILMVLAFYRESVRRRVEFTSISKIFLTGFTALNLFIYFSSNLKPLRYLYPLVLPVGFVSAKITESADYRNLIYIFAVLNLVLGGAAVLERGIGHSEPFQDVSSRVNCMTESNSWAMINYAGTPSRPPLEVSATESSLNVNNSLERARNGYRIIDFGDKIFGELEESKRPPLIEERYNYKIYGYSDRCAEPEKVKTTYLERYSLEKEMELNLKTLTDLVKGR